MFTRRFAIIAGLSAAGVPGFSKDFWIEKKPDQWSEKELEKLLNHSPWAKEVTAELTMSGGGGGGGGRMGGGSGLGGMQAESSAGMGGGEMPGPGGGRGGRGGGGGGMGEMPQRPQINGQVRWESAPVVRAAQKRALPKDMEPFYVVSLNLQPTPMMMGMLMGGGGPRGERGGQRPEGEPRPDPEARRAALLERMKETTELQRKGKDPIHPERVLTGQGEGRLVFVFLFSRTGQPIELQDKEVTFLCSMGPAKFKTKFSLKDMVFDGKLDL
jgi:hypothetical protein